MLDFTHDVGFLQPKELGDMELKALTHHRKDKIQSTVFIGGKPVRDRVLAATVVTPGGCSGDCRDGWDQSV